MTPRAVAFESDPHYLGMKEEYATQMRDAAADYGSMIHQQLMHRKQGTSLDPRKQRIVNKYSNDKTGKAALRALVKDIWIDDLHESCGPYLSLVL